MKTFAGDRGSPDDLNGSRPHTRNHPNDREGREQGTDDEGGGQHARQASERLDGAELVDPLFFGDFCAISVVTRTL